MKFFLFSLCLVFSTVTFFQNSFSEADAKNIIDTFFEGFHEGDTSKMRSVMASKMMMQSTFSTKDGKNQIARERAEDLLKAIADPPDPETSGQKWNERLLGYTVQIDGNLAHVWIPLNFGLMTHFAIVELMLSPLQKRMRVGKSSMLIDSRRKSDCQK